MKAAWRAGPFGVIRDLLGDHVGLRHQIPRPGGRFVKSGVVFDQTPEEEAFHRWRDGKFQDVERIAAGVWRKVLSELDLVTVQKELRSIGFTQQSCKTLQDAKAIADALVNGTDNPLGSRWLFTFFTYRNICTPTSPSPGKDRTSEH